MSFDGLLNNTCNIEVATRTQDAGGQMAKSWANLSTGIKCRLSGSGGGESRNEAFAYYKATHMLFIREIAGVTLNTSSHRVDVGGTKYKILHINIVDSMALTNHIELMLEEIK